MRQQLKQSLTNWKNLLYPTVCAGCGQWDEIVCHRCARCFTSHLRAGALCLHPPVSTWFLCPYEGAARNLILAAKHSPRLKLDKYFHAAGYHAGQSLLSATAENWLSCEAPKPLWIIPAPSHRARFGTRSGGPSVAEVFAQGIGQALAQHEGVSRVTVARLLAMKPGAASQAGRGQEARLRGRAGQMRPALDDLTMLRGARVILVDDVCTTGATLREMVRVLQPFEGEIVAIVTFAQARPVKTVHTPGHLR